MEVQIEFYDHGLNDNLMALMLSADPDETRIRDYFDKSVVFVAKVSNHIVGIIVVSLDIPESEVINLAVSQEVRGKGIAKKLLFKACDYCSYSGAASVLVGTGNSSLNQLALYQKCGFRLSHIERGYFSCYPEPIFENGIQCLDMVVLVKSL